MSSGTKFILVLALGLASCCFSGGGVGSLLPPPSIRYTPDPWLVNWGPAYESRLLSDDDPSTYWCAPSGTPFPIVGLMQLEVPSDLVSVDFDNRVSGYETSGIREVTIEPLGAGGVPIGVPVRAVLNQNAITTVPMTQPGVWALRVTFASNYGGTYAVLAELALRSELGRGLAPLPAMPIPPPMPIPPSFPSGVPAIPPSVPPPPPMPVPPVVAPAGPPTGLPYIVDAGESYPGYPADNLHDGNPGTYWCSNPSPYFPYILTLTLTPPGMVSAVEINSAIAAYPDIGPNQVTILALSDTGGILNVTNGTALPNATTRIPLVAPVNAAQLRVTLQENHGGSYAGIAELSVLP